MAATEPSFLKADRVADQKFDVDPRLGFRQPAQQLGPFTLFDSLPGQHLIGEILNPTPFQVPCATAVLALLTFLAGSAAAQDRNEFLVTQGDASSNGNAVRVEKGALLQLSVSGNKSWKRISKNSILEGRLALPVYAGEEIAIPADTELRLSIDSVAKVSDGAGIWRKLGRGLVRAFNPLQSGPQPEYVVRMTAVEAVLADGSLLPLKTRVLRAGNGVMIEPQAPHSNGAQDHSQPSRKAAASRPKPRQTLLLCLDEEILWPVAVSPASDALDREHSQAISATRARAFVLTALSASHNHEGDLFQAQLAEPVRLGGQVFEAGSMLQGRVLRRRPPRMLSRAGFLSLRVDQVTSPHAGTLPVTGTLDNAEADPGTRFVLDEEGQLRGLKPGIKNALVDLGITYAVGKTADDIAETPIRAIGAGMSNAAVANAARYVGIGATAIFLVTRHGRDVHLPKYAEIDVDFGRVERKPL